MTSNDTGRPIGSNPIADAASATAPTTQHHDPAITVTPEDFDQPEGVPDAADQPDEQNEADMLQQSGSETGAVDEHGHQPRDKQFTPVE